MVRYIKLQNLLIFTKRSVSL